MLIRRLRRIVRTRAVLSVVALLSLAASSAEALSGDIRDGAEHHETVAAALEHRATQGAEHRHLAESGRPAYPGAPASHDGGEQHHHPGGLDHCAHLHGVGLPASFAMALGTSVTGKATVTSRLPSSFSPPALLRPPRA